MKNLPKLLKNFHSVGTVSGFYRNQIEHRKFYRKLGKVFKIFKNHFRQPVKVA